VGVVGIAVAGALAFLAVLGLVVSHRADEGTRIRRRYANVLVPVEGALAGAGSVVDVATFDGLERLATMRDRAILHGVEWGADCFYVDDDAALYRYRAVSAGRPSVANA
jgi:hypothetical protein